MSDAPHLIRPVFRRISGQESLTHRDIQDLSAELWECHQDAKNCVVLASSNWDNKLAIAWLELGRQGESKIMVRAEEGFAEPEFKTLIARAHQIAEGIH